MEEFICCTLCNAELTEDDPYSMDDESFFIACAEDNTIICSRCGEHIWDNDNAGDTDMPLCNSCYDYHYTSCIRCGCIVANEDTYYTEGDEDNDNPYCYNCYDRYDRNTYLRCYNYKPNPIFHGEGPRYFGIELEIDNAGKNEENAEILYRLGNKRESHIYIKADSSLDNGLEIVTHPMSYEYHLRSMPWQAVIERASELGYTSHQSDTCGLHIHVNRDSFTDSYVYQEECIARVLYLLERFWQEFLRFSRRTQSQLKRWANRYGYKEKPEEILNSAKYGYGGRYTCVNITNADTIEFRIFRGTLKYNTLIATLQLVNEICDVAFSMSDEDIASLSWCGFMEKISSERCPELIQYLKERRLYINEPIRCELEV